MLPPVPAATVSQQHYSKLPHLTTSPPSMQQVISKAVRVQVSQQMAITPPPTPPHNGWSYIAHAKRSQREANLRKHQSWRLDTLPAPNTLDVSQIILSKLSARENEIVHLDATAITHAIRSRTYTSVEVLTAFCKAAVAAQDTTNCITEIFFEEAFTRARELDVHLARTGEVVGPLHGLPVSIKDHILIKGQDTSTGYIAWAGERIADKDAVVVDILRKAGAVLYVKTANPQTLLCLETDNNIFGRTVNPFNRKLSPGGSSGGEGALIASHGSPMGVGTDIGGSIRIPAAYSGLYGFKPSVARMPHAGLLGSHDGMDNIVGVVGPLATSARDLELFCRTMLESDAWLMEHAVLEIPWRERSQLKMPERLSYAILWDDGVVKPHPPLIRELQRAKEALLAAGHEVIEWEPLEHQEGWDLIVQLYLLDGGQEYWETIQSSGEPATPSVQWMLDHAKGRAPFTVPQTWKLNCEREQFRARALAHWNSTQHRTSTGRPVDAILCPTSATLAVPHDKTRWWGYSSHWNLLDLPGVVFPSGGRFVPEEFEFTGAEGGVVARNEVEKEVWGLWDPETYRGAPIALQLIGRRHNEEKVLAMLDVVEKAMKKAYA